MRFLFLFKRGSALTCDGVLAPVALLGHVGLEAVHAVDVVLVGSEPSLRQRFAAGVAHEALGVPGVILVADPSGADGLRRDRGHPETRAAKMAPVRSAAQTPTFLQWKHFLANLVSWQVVQ